MQKKRLRVFAGPNGSGKSTIFTKVDERYGCPCFVNADEIQEQLSATGRLPLNRYAILVNEDHLRTSYLQSGFYERAADAFRRDRLIETLRVKDNTLVVDPSLPDAYFSAFVADFLRINMLNIVQEFSIETVMSDPRKIEYIDLAKKFGYRIYLYFVSTKDVRINIRRVTARVESGGHSVPEEKIRDRYKKSLDNVFEMLKRCDRAYFFDNSDDNDNKDNTSWKLLAEYDGDMLELSPDMDEIPDWLYAHVIAKMLPHG